ncbi:hypothetical protein ABID16_004046 [Rhizobium aquaticum]|uniref:Uncharacterized protein n=1 Tax=Rhizobium aquaticum TaxID=1549636 RepID=A0ABV2J7E1_9HYPH
MSLSFEQMMSHPDRRAIVRHLASAFLELHAADPLTGAVFSTQQRWLMAQVGIALYFRELTGDGPPAYTASVLDKVEAEQIAARNTAHAFMLEMLKYGVVQYRSPEKKGKVRLLCLPDSMVAAITGWINLHLHMLDCFDGGCRSATFQRVPQSVRIVQPAVADELAASRSMRLPQGAFANFTWLKDGGHLMDQLIAGLEPGPEQAERTLTNIVSITELAEQVKVSRTHLGRKLMVAEQGGFLGWTGRRGHSTLWLSAAFRKEYEAYQINKLALVERAFDTVSARLLAS